MKELLVKMFSCIISEHVLLFMLLSSHLISMERQDLIGYSRTLYTFHFFEFALKLTVVFTIFTIIFLQKMNDFDQILTLWVEEVGSRHCTGGRQRRIYIIIRVSSSNSAY